MCANKDETIDQSAHKSKVCGIAIEKMFNAQGNNNRNTAHNGFGGNHGATVLLGARFWRHDINDASVFYFPRTLREQYRFNTTEVAALDLVHGDLRTGFFTNEQVKKMPFGIPLFGICCEFGDMGPIGGNCFYCARSTFTIPLVDFGSCFDHRQPIEVENLRIDGCKSVCTIVGWVD